MLETNIRIVKAGEDFFLRMRRVLIEGPVLSPDLIERACGRLRYRNSLAAVRDPHDRHALIVATDRAIQPISLDGEDWTLALRDADEPTRTLCLGEDLGRDLIPELIERLFLVQLARRTQLRTIDSPRIWHEPIPFRSEGGIAAYRRFEVGSILLDGVGVGIAVDVRTAFFSEATLEYFFASNLTSLEKRARCVLFAKLTGRQRDQKGTLLYTVGNRQLKCYFDHAPDGVTCGTSGPVRVRGKTFPSLLEYYQSAYPQLPVAGETPAVWVSFRGIEKPTPVAADKLRVRVTNDDVPYPLGSVDKIDPADRRRELISFWNTLEPKPLGNSLPGFCDGLWRPDATRIDRFPLPALHFRHNQILPQRQPEPGGAGYREHYSQRLKYLQNAGCYYVPPAVDRTLYFASPQGRAEQPARQLAENLTARISAWTGLAFRPKFLSFPTIQRAVEQLRGFDPPSVVVFVLNDEPSAYYEVAFQLAGWRIKRITERELVRHHDYLNNGARFQRQSPRQNPARWDQFVVMNALGVLQLLDCVPWRVNQLGPYDAQVAIDVGHDRRYFAVSILISRQDDRVPPLWIDSVAMAKPDHQHEAINPVMLADTLLELFRRTKPLKFEALDSLLILRDGHSDTNELNALVTSVQPTLVAEGYLRREARFDVFDFRKKSAKSIRLWEIDKADQACNSPEGIAVKLNADMAVVATTGSATLRQGTAQPFIVVSRSGHLSVLAAAHSTFDAAQMNFSSPRVAQRLPLIFQRTDEELSARAAQEIRRLR